MPTLTTSFQFSKVTPARGHKYSATFYTLLTGYFDQMDWNLFTSKSPSWKKLSQGDTAWSLQKVVLEWYINKVQHLIIIPQAGRQGMVRLTGDPTSIVKLFPLQVTSTNWYPMQHHPVHIQVKLHDWYFETFPEEIRGKAHHAFGHGPLWTGYLYPPTWKYIKSPKPLEGAQPFPQKLDREHQHLRVWHGWYLQRLLRIVVYVVLPLFIQHEFPIGVIR